MRYRLRASHSLSCDIRGVRDPAGAAVGIGISIDGKTAGAACGGRRRGNSGEEVRGSRSIRSRLRSPGRGDSAGAMAMTARQGFNQVGMVAHATPIELTAVFQVNGLPFATVRGDPGHPTIQGADGRALTGAEVDALIGISDWRGGCWRCSIA